MSILGERASDTLIDDLPNLKIEIENDLQHMETDEGSLGSNKVGSVSSDTEEGEVVDDDEGLGVVNGKSNSALKLATQIVPTGRSILKYDTKVRPEHAIFF